MNNDEFRKHAHAFVDWMADYMESVERHPVRSQVEPGEILGKLPPVCPERGEAMEAIFSDFRERIMPGITHWQHPRFFAYFPANSSPPSVLAEMLTAALAAQCMLWETSPAATELEARMMDWLRQLLGLPSDFTGCIQDTASTSTLLALIAACERATGGRFSRDGMAGHAPLTVYASAEAHSAVEKAARIAGLGRRNVRRIPVSVDYGMDPGALMAAIRKDRSAGFVPACITATFGTTGIGAVDPLSRIGPLAGSENIHLHVDAAWAGSALILPEIRPLIEGIEFADSFVFNPHKWLSTNFDCSAFYLRDPSALAQALSLTPAFLESRSGADIPEYRDWSVALGRRFRALKLWFVLRSYGAEDLRARIRRHIAWTERLAGHIRRTPDFELTTEPRFALLTFRYVPPGEGSDVGLDALNEALLARINDQGRTYLTKTRADGRLVIRFAVGQTSTEWRHVEEAWACIQDTARSVVTAERSK